MPRKRRLRLSFIGGRRPSLCPPIKKIAKDVLSNEVAGQSEAADIKPKVLENESQPEVADIKPKEKSQNKKKSKIKNEDNLFEMEIASMKQSREVKDKAILDTLTKEVNDLETEKEEWLKNYFSFCKEINDMNPFENFQIPQDLKNLLEFDIRAEIKKCQDLNDDFVINTINSNNIKEELNIRKLQLHIKFEELSKEMKLDNIVCETPKHLIKKIIF
ncbi:uncharacterized protein LOC100205117 isoform X6 [Hydra vulgaris]|uniref:Uncharacterized protein LOC100205117 isoform X6 n=1 Tax=Hydra vulgaris TaxID=6087 RepID=A0ABM4CPM9_HYDVU